jgi:hypothetical protein
LKRPKYRSNVAEHDLYPTFFEKKNHPATFRGFEVLQSSFFHTFGQMADVDDSVKSAENRRV